MDIKFIFLALMIFTIVQFNSACDRTERICKKYCEIERVSCAGLKHPICTKFNATDTDTSVRSKILNITNSDVRNTILFEINRFRNDLAFGYVEKQGEAANLQVVYWSFDLQLILEAQLQYKNVCNRISPNGTEFVEMQKFQVYKKTHFYQLTEFTNTIKSSYSKIEWNPLIRAEFNEIGCVVTEENSAFNLICLTNKKLSENVTFDPQTAYETGSHCSSCRCSEFWNGLCDGYTSHDDRNGSEDHHLDHDTNDVDYVVVYVMIIVIVLLMLIIVGFLCLVCLCVERISKPDEQGTYTLRHKFYSKQQRGTLFEK